MSHGVAMTIWPQCHMVWLWPHDKCHMVGLWPHDHNVTWCGYNHMTTMLHGVVWLWPQCHMATHIWLFYHNVTWWHGYDCMTQSHLWHDYDRLTCRRLYAYYYKVTCSQGQCNLVSDFCDKINFVTGPWLRHVCNCDTVLWSHGLFLPLVSKPPPLPPNPFWSMKIVKGYLHHFLLP